MSITNYFKVVLLHREKLPRLVIPGLTELVSGGYFAAAGFLELSEFAYSGVRILAERFVSWGISEKFPMKQKTSPGKARSSLKFSMLYSMRITQGS